MATGTYTTPTGAFTLPTTGAIAGTYQWNASYNGDPNNNAVSDNGSASEQVIVSAAVPTITTTPTPTTVTLSDAIPPILTDSAVLAGGASPTGTITFTLFFNGGTVPVDTETVTVSGNGTYTTPTGFTLPSAGTASGTYQWNASYSGDAINNPASDIGSPDEQVTVSAATPTVITTPDPTEVTLGTTPVTLNDSAVLAGGFSPTGTITFTLFFNGGTTPVDTETVTVNGNGTYTTPTGFTVPATGNDAGNYEWDATYSGDGNNNSVSDNDPANEEVVVRAAGPTITTTPSPTTVTLSDAIPPALTDSAVLAGGADPTGTITFTLFFNRGATPGDTETVTVSGNGTYTTPTGFTLPTTGAVPGTYQWNASYSGDANNSPVSDIGSVKERVFVSAASPTIATTPSPTTVTLSDLTPPILTDSATLSGGFNPTGSITFTLFQNGGTTPVDTETVNVASNGTYTTPTGFTLPTTGTVAGTYQWDASYSGDSNNNPVSDTGSANEQVTVNTATPIITTTPSPATITLDDAISPILTDSATLSGGFHPTGTISFTLFFNGGTTPVDTETVTVTGNGTYTTPTGFTLPTTGAVAGTYQWDASYSGDPNNNPVSDNGSANEQVVVNAASPAINTTSSPSTVTLSAAAPPILKDSAVLAGGFRPTGTITFTLFFNGGTTPVDTETAAVRGNGTYTTPTGFTLPTTGTVTGTTQWDASYSGDANNNPVSDNGSANEQVIVARRHTHDRHHSPTPTAVPLSDATPPTLTDSATLAGGFDATGTITFTLFQNGGATPVDTESVTVTGNGTYTTPTGFTLPSTGTVAGTYQWDASYNGDPNNNAVSDNGSANEQVTVSAASPTITTTPNPTTVTLSDATPPVLTDSATLSGGFNPTGSITFTLFFDGEATPVDIETVTVSGNGTYTTPTGFTLPTTATAAGTYEWNASYSGDPNNNTVSDNDSPSEQVTVSAASPTITTTPNPTMVTLGTTPVTLNDSAVLAAGFNPTGLITFTLFVNGGTTPVDTEQIAVNGNGTYTTPTGFTLPTTGAIAGTYQWNASYNGDPNNNAVSDNGSASEQVIVSAAGPTITTTPSPTTVTLTAAAPPILTDSADLAGGSNPTGIITFTLFQNGGTTPVDTETVVVTGNETYTTPAGYTLPTTGTVTGTYQWDASYSGDPNNNPVSDNGSANEQVTVSTASPTLTTTPNPIAFMLSAATPPILTDSAVLAGGFSPIGTITFTLFFNGGTTPVDTETVAVTGNGTYTTPTGFTLPTTGSVTGTYQWDASYDGDPNNNPVSDNGSANEQVTVSDASPTITTTPDPTTVTLSALTPPILTDSATLSGGFSPAGTITFTLFQNGGTTPVDTETVAVTGNGTFTTPTGFTLPTTGTVTGTYQWDATYGGDGNNKPGQR